MWSAVREFASPCEVSTGDGEAMLRTRFAPLCDLLIMRFMDRICRFYRASGFFRRSHMKKSTPSMWSAFFHGDPYGNRTHVTAVKGPCLNRLTNGPSLVADVGFEPTTCRV